MTYEADIPGTESLTEVRPARRPAPTMPEQQAEAAKWKDHYRTRRRVEIKNKIASAQLAEKRHAELSEAVAAVNAAKEQLACEHVARCAPLQAELAQIEKKQIAELISKSDADPTLMARRKDLLAELADYNGQLDADIADKDALMARLVEDRRLAGVATGDLALRATLLVETAREDLHIAARVARSRHDWAGARLAKAQQTNTYWSAAEAADAALDVAKTNELLVAAEAAVVDE